MTLGGVDQTTPFDTALKDFASASSITSSSTTAVAAYYSTTRPTRPRLRRSMRERRRWWLTALESTPHATYKPAASAAPFKRVSP